MKRLAIVAVFAAVGFLILRARGPKLHERLLARCEGMFERMPDTFPPKRMMSGIDEVRTNTARIRDLLEAREAEATSKSSGASTRAMHDN
jgi:hypothetical protein